jgi:bifunctional DNA-binding transcriptional regulator/antitoxin component of YhaV-PrlF toxin-antitoxin module
MRQIFAHTETTHQLITHPERALKRYGIKIGDKVEFMYKNSTYTGIVNRITKRATVLVEHSDRRLYTDQKNYLKYYIPLSKLKKIVEPVKG